MAKLQTVYQQLRHREKVLHSSESRHSRGANLSRSHIRTSSTEVSVYMYKGRSSFVLKVHSHHWRARAVFTGSVIYVHGQWRGERYDGTTYEHSYWPLQSKNNKNRIIR